jgi:hypothetical protein
VTLVLTVNGPESIWLLADRRLSNGKDDARKLMVLETTDGVAILGYAGLGATALGTEPADWMRAVLRCRNNPLEHSLSILARAMEKQLPRHVVQLPGPAHNIIIPAFLGNEPRLYTIDLAFAPDRKTYRFRYTRHVGNKPTPATARPPRLGLGGSGAGYLTQDKKWMRGLLRMVRASDRGQVSPGAVADYLANLNTVVHLGIPDKSVGPRCIVAWRHRKEGVHKDGGGHAFYTNSTRESNTPAIPTITHGWDGTALIDVEMAHIEKAIKAMREGRSAMLDLDKDALNADLARLPDKPDENLR